MTNYEWVRNLKIRDMVDLRFTSWCLTCIYRHHDFCPRDCYNGYKMWLEQEHDDTMLENK